MDILTKDRILNSNIIHGRKIKGLINLPGEPCECLHGYFHKSNAAYKVNGTGKSNL